MDDKCIDCGGAKRMTRHPRCRPCGRTVAIATKRQRGTLHSGASHYRWKGGPGVRPCDAVEYQRRRSRRSHLKRQYGLTLKEVDALRARQEGRCVLCLAETDLVVDHDHETGQVRGLLCQLCNTGIGALRHNAEVLQRAIGYLT